MIRAFKKINGTTQLDVLPLDDSTAGVAAQAQIDITGTATSSGKLYVSIASESEFKYELDVSVDDTGDDVIDSLNDLLVVELSKPFTVIANNTNITFTAANTGSLANGWPLIVKGDVPGITVALTKWAGGSDNPVLTSVLDTIENIRYRTVIWPSVYSLDTIETLLDSRFNEDFLIMDGVAIQTKVGTLAGLKSYADQNSQSVCIIGNKVVDQSDRAGGAIMEMPDIISAQFGAFRALKIELNKSLTQYLTTSSSLDQFGNVGNSSLPYFNTLLPNLPVPDPRDVFTLEEQDELTKNGISIISANRSYNGTILGQFVTTYMTNNAGNNDDSYKFLEVVDTASAIREYFYENFRARYAQTRLTEGDIQPGRDMANAGSIRAFCNKLYTDLAVNTLVHAGTLAKKDFNDNLSIVVDVRTGTVKVDMAPLLVTQLRVVLGTIRINFGD
jgi:phage tail sheath gpL-like